MLDVVYQSEVEGLRAYVEALDFDVALTAARKFVDENGVRRVRQTFHRCAEFLRPVAAFPVYLTVEIGHADLLAHWDRVADREMIARFIESGTPYLVGGLLIARLIKEGRDVRPLTRTPTADIARLGLA